MSYVLDNEQISLDFLYKWESQTPMRMVRRCGLTNAIAVAGAG